MIPLIDMFFNFNLSINNIYSSMLTNSRIRPSERLNQSINQLIPNQATNSLQDIQVSSFGQKLIKNQIQRQQSESNPQIDFHRAAHCNTIFYQYSTSTIYIPVYMNIQLKAINSMNYEALIAQQGVKIILNTFTKGLPQHVCKFIDQNICIQFKRDPKIVLSDNRSVIKSEYHLKEEEYQYMMYGSHAEKFHNQESKIRKRKNQIIRKLSKLKIKKSQRIDRALSEQEEKIQKQLEECLQKYINSPIKKPIKGYKNQQNQKLRKQKQKNVSEISKQNSKKENKGLNIHPKWSESLKLIIQNKLQKHHKAEQSLKQKPKDITVGMRYTIRTQLHAFIEPYVFLSPFETLDLILTIKIPKLHYIDEHKKQKCLIKFNLMDHQGNQTYYITKRINVMPQAASFKHYNIATKRMIAQYTRNGYSKTLMSLGKTSYSIKCLDIKRQQVQIPTVKQVREMSTSFAHFHIPLIRNPQTSLTTHFLPLWLFSAISIGVFFLSPALADRLAILSTVMIALVNLIPATRHKMPMSPILTIFQILTFLQLMVTVLCLVQSLIIKDINEQIWNDFSRTYTGLTDPFYQTGLAITLFVIFVPLIMFIVYYIANYKNVYFLIDEQWFDVDNQFSTWTNNDQADVAFRNDENLNDIIFMNQDENKFTGIIDQLLYHNYIQQWHEQIFRNILKMYVTEQLRQSMLL